MSERVRVEVSGHVAEVTMVRGDKHNGLDPAMFDQLNAAIDEVRADRSVRAVVLRGDGPSFCAGLDFAAWLATGKPIQDGFESAGDEPVNVFQRVAYGWQGLVEVPVIAALHGNCLGGGLQIALGADIRIGAPDLKMSVMEIKWGLIPDMGITQALPRLVRVDQAKELIYSGRVVAAEEALELGLVTRVADDPVAAAHELAAQLATKSPDAIRRGKRLVDESWTAAPADALALEEQLQRELLGSPNQMLAVQAGMSGEAADFADPE